MTDAGLRQGEASQIDYDYRLQQHVVRFKQRGLAVVCYLDEEPVDGAEYDAVIGILRDACRDLRTCGPKGKLP